VSSDIVLTMSYVQNRVYVATYGSLPSDSPLLVPIPTAPGRPQQRAHVLVARAIVPFAAAVKRDLGIDLLFASGWRPHLWKSWNDYCEALLWEYREVVTKMLKREPTYQEIISYGQRYRAFSSAHETGLAVDAGCGGLSPVSATIEIQKKTRLYRYVKDKMWKYGFTPYLPEPWHFELNVPIDQYHAPGLSLDPVQMTAAVHHESPVCDSPECCEAEHETGSFLA
jgi:hypothetical protein